MLACAAQDWGDDDQGWLESNPRQSNGRVGRSTMSEEERKFLCEVIFAHISCKPRLFAPDKTFTGSVQQGGIDI